jgi:hypothetical protein
LSGSKEIEERITYDDGKISLGKEGVLVMGI